MLVLLLLMGSFRLRRRSLLAISVTTTLRLLLLLLLVVSLDIFQLDRLVGNLNRLSFVALVGLLSPAAGGLRPVLLVLVVDFRHRQCLALLVTALASSVALRTNT